MPLIIGQKGSSRCCCGDCRGFPAFDGSHRFFKYATAYDFDCCQFAQCVDDAGRDGKIKFESTGCGFGKVVESTGNYLKSFRNGECIDCKSLYPLDTIRELLPGLLQNPYMRCRNYFSTSPDIVNPTKATALYDGNCCNALGDKIYWELTEEITDGTCDKMGACCGWKNYGGTSPTLQLDDKSTCRMCHQCECDTDKGETWHGEGSSCGPNNPCFCKGFKAFDGSNQWFRYARLIDEDTCYLNGARYDGGILLEWNEACCCSVTAVNTALRENSGKVIDSYGAYQTLDYYPLGSCVTIPLGHVATSVHNSATFCSLGKSVGCGNPEGDKIGWQLSSSISCNILP